MIDSLEVSVIVEHNGMNNLMDLIRIAVGGSRIGAAGVEEISKIMVQEVHKEMQEETGIEEVILMAGAQVFKYNTNRIMGVAIQV